MHYTLYAGPEGFVNACVAGNLKQQMVEILFPG